MQVGPISQTRITAAKTLPNLFQAVRDFLSEGHRRLVSISPRCPRRNEYTLSFTFKFGEGLFESEILRTPLDFAGKIFKRGIEKIVIRSGVMEADLSALVRLLENDFAKLSLREFSRPQIEIRFVKIAPTPAATPEARPSASLPSAAPAPKPAPAPRPPIVEVAPPSVPVQPVSAPSQAAQELDVTIVNNLLEERKRINRALMQTATPELESDMREWIRKAEIAILCFNEFARTHRSAELLRKRSLFSELNQRIRSFKQKLNDNSATTEVILFTTDPYYEPRRRGDRRGF